MWASLAIVLPVFGLIGLGYAARRLGLVSDATGEGLSDFVFTLSVPCLIFRTLARAELPAVQPWGLLDRLFRRRRDRLGAREPCGRAILPRRPHRSGGRGFCRRAGEHRPGWHPADPQSLWRGGRGAAVPARRDPPPGHHGRRHAARRRTPGAARRDRQAPASAPSDPGAARRSPRPPRGGGAARAAMADHHFLANAAVPCSL